MSAHKRKNHHVSLRNLSVKLEDARIANDTSRLQHGSSSSIREEREKDETEKRNGAGNGSCHEVYIILDVAYVTTAFAG